jgi:hypothetical protein
MMGGTVAPGAALSGAIQFATGTGQLQNGPSLPALASTSGPSLNGDSSAISGNLGLSIDVFPDPTRGWHVGGLLGLGFFSVTQAATKTSMTGGSLAASLFGGYDWYLGKSFSFGVMGVVFGMPRMGLKDSNGNDTGYNMFPVSVGLNGSLVYY